MSGNAGGHVHQEARHVSWIRTHRVRLRTGFPGQAVLEAVQRRPDARGRLAARPADRVGTTSPCWRLQGHSP
ncbi:hypothetical protein [Umezawaea sp. Da 62-37]|uniref:hypothetical protein n=1 Tax=Umezawaea sp. Da 62-37 TaxID=3075927 RepID=UPI0028F71204|nr:hypothetical protein [Umezawaea sp. Da 62-37]WNV92206.1 hypothetical protein RM788_16745 [Umezawaea sp. Da 62-37]